MSNGKGVRTQNLRDFTVQIRNPKTDAIVGTGIVVSTDGKIVTCAHVVKAAINRVPRVAGDREIGVYFPQAREGEKAHKAKVVAFFPNHDDDVVLLQLNSGQTPLGPELLPDLGSADKSDDHKFKSYGYKRLDAYHAGIADGIIQGLVEPPRDRNLQSDPVQLKSTQINWGMSGSAVLDIDRNLVVGIVSESYFSKKTVKDSDTAWAVDTRVLTFDPLKLSLQSEDRPKQPAPSPKTDVEAARKAAVPSAVPAWNNPPTILKEWTGREQFLKQITDDWNDPNTTATGLIGFGGEGKSSIARQWVENLLKGKKETRPDGVFWWGFYESPSVDEFFEAALKYMSGGKIDPRKIPSSGAKAQVIAAMLGAGRYLFVLDGLEVMQHQEGDRYGLLKSNDLRDFLEYFGGDDVKSFCQITSRAPMLNLMDYTTYNHRDVTRLLPEDGRELLRKIGVKGQDEELDQIVTDWDGHALTLSLLGSCIAEKYSGDISRADIEIPTADEKRYERVHRVLRRYDEHLDKAERAFMALFSAFRTPVKESAFEKVFRTKTGDNALNAPISKLSKKKFSAMIRRLLVYRMLRYDEGEKAYTSHPLIRNHYQAIFTKSGQTKDAHESIKDYYLEIAGDVPTHPTLEDLKPWLEVVHHLCMSGAYDEAFEIRTDRIDQKTRFVITHELGSDETSLSIMKDFFHDYDLTSEPQVSKPLAKSTILNEIGLCLMSLGRLKEATRFCERGIVMSEKNKNWANASIGHQNLSDMSAHLGELVQCNEAADKALDLARRSGYKRVERNSMAFKAWMAHLSGDKDEAGKYFREAESFEQDIDSDERYLYGRRGNRHAEYLRRHRNIIFARKVVKANLRTCKSSKWLNEIGRCNRVLGDLDSDEDKHTSAIANFQIAVKTARAFTIRHDLIEALFARGRWYGKYMHNAEAAFNDLNEALDYATDGGYRIYEADIRVGLAWANWAQAKSNLGQTGTYAAHDDIKSAREQAERALRMSEDMGYHWGQVDAKEVLEEIKKVG